MPSSPSVSIAVFASGSGSNAEAIIQYFKSYQQVAVRAIFTNNSKAGVEKVGQAHGLPIYTFRKSTLYEETQILNALYNAGIDFIVLAGFLLLMPPGIVEAYRGRVVNLHPALLPKYGGKGMYGKAVHQAVKEHGDRQTGITIHYVNEAYDEGQIIQQCVCEVDPEQDTPDTIEKRVRALEHQYYPPAVAHTIQAVFGIRLT